MAAYCGFSPLHTFADTNTLASAQPVARGKTLVVIFLRGGMDGLNFIVPYADEHYYKLRRNIAVARPGPSNGALDLDGFFGLNPAARPLHEWFQRGDAVALHAVGYARNTRSHFEEQDVWETGVIGNTVSSDGWLNRHLATSTGHGPVRAVSIGDNLPRILRGDAPAYAVRGIEDLNLPPSQVGQERIAAALEHAYCTQPKESFESARSLLGRTAQATLEGIRQLRSVASQKYVPDAKYPETGLARRLKETARLIKANVGVEVVEVDYGGWDTHNAQGAFGGAYHGLVSELSGAVAAFAQDLGDRLNDTLLVTISEFGRTAEENGTAGTDHGWANCLLALGGSVRARSAGRARNVIGKWPGLAPDALHDRRDLSHTTDFRDVFGELVTRHLGNSQIQKVLPRHEFREVGLI
jgi:uncharacterized protein (DUF1501 family)